MMTTPEIIDKISNLVDKNDVVKMINSQAAAIERLETTNKSLVECSELAHSKLSSITKLFKKTTQQMKDSKKDLDLMYKKLTDLKSKIRAERPDLYAADRQGVEQDDTMLSIQSTSSSLQQKDQIEAKPTDI